MQNVRGLIISLSLSAALLLTGGAAFAQAPAAAAPAASTAKLTFDVATVKPSPPLDMGKLQSEVQAGRMPKFGPHVEADRAEYTYMALKDLIAVAYKIKPYQVTGPDWLGTERFDILATFPQGATKDDVPAMLQALLADRFKLVAHLDTQEHPVLGLVVGKGGLKLKESTVAATPINEDTPLKPGEMKMDTPDGPARMTRNPDGSSTVNMGARGTFTQKMDGQNLRIEASTITMSGFADMLTQMMQIGGGSSRQVVDMTGLKGNYQVAVELSLADLIAAARAAGVDVPNGPGGAGDAPAASAPSDPSGGVTVYESVQRLGLKLEQRKAPVEQLVVDHIEKTPTDN